jgi:hypothetical protein
MGYKGKFTQSVRAGAMALAALLLAPLPAFATDALIEGARLCTQHFPEAEQKNGIPTNLLAAIATTESGRWHDGLGMAVPWPWTINVDGKGYYFNSKAEAIAHVQEFQRQGHESIDVGCMQVNLKHHPHAFANLEQAFDPAANVDYAATFLHDNYAELGDWIKATAAYHSRTPVYGNQYLGEIERSWSRIVAKVTTARANMGIQPTPVTTASTAAGSAQPSAPTAKPAATLASTSLAPMHPITATHNVHVVQVHDSAAKPSSGVLVIRAEPATITSLPAAPATSMNVAQAAVVASPATTTALVQQVGDSVRHVSLGDTPAPAQPSGGAKFVFAN